MIATFRKRQPAKVAPIALRRGLLLKVLDRIGRVPKMITITKKTIMTTILRIVKI